MKFLRQLFTRQDGSSTLMMAANDELCQVLPAQTISNGTQLQVAAGQNALLFNGTKRSTIFPTGDHLLDIQEIRDVLDGGQANILFLQIAPPVKREWQLLFHPEGHSEPLMLSGHYTAAIDDTRLFVAALLKSGKKPANQPVDAWLRQHILNILNKQRIPAHDIHQHTDKLAVFLHDALIPHLLDTGIRLQNFTLRVQQKNLPHEQTPGKMPPQEAPTPPSPPLEPVIPMLTGASPSQPTPQKTTEASAAGTSPILPRPVAPKIFYRLEKGKQIGPYSLDEINALIKEGKIRRHDLLWHQGMKSWQSAGELPALDW